MSNLRKNFFAIFLLLIAAALHQNIQHVAVLVDGPPKVMPLAIDHEKHLVQMPFITGLGTPVPEFIRIRLAELAAPLPDGFIGHDNPTVIYTSESTGRPKGVQITHRNIVNFITSRRCAPGCSSADTFLVVTPISFDFSINDMFLPLAAGAMIVIASHGDVTDGCSLIEHLNPFAVSAMNATPSTWRLLLEAGWKGSPQLAVLCGGEALTLQLAESLLPCCRVLWNLYGPTETTVFSSIQKIESRAEKIPIGRPIANTQMYILDPHLQPVPVGVSGELYIGGIGLARGYFNQPALTAEKFLPDPFSHTPGARLYKTGDMARYLPDGSMEFLGRLDHQIKLRGFRVELREIEAVLQQHPRVQDAVVVLWEETPNDKRLVAYVVPRPDSTSPTPSDLQHFLSLQLPAYMLPATVMFLETLPLTPNSKIARQALPAPTLNRPAPEETFVAPRSPIEEAVASFWTEVIWLERVGVHDNFFDLGGHSLLATQVMSRIRSTFQVDLPLQRLFAAPTVAGLAACIVAARRETGSAQAPPLRSIPWRGVLPLSYTQERLWFLEQWDPGSFTYNIPSAFHLTGTLDVMTLERSLNEIVRRHDALRTNFTLVEGQPIQTIVASLTLRLPVIDLRPLPESS